MDARDWLRGPPGRLRVQWAGLDVQRRSDSLPLAPESALVYGRRKLDSKGLPFRPRAPNSRFIVK